ncbi:MAG: ATP-binding cassette domain-containing protein [Candidatus Nanopelagicales bacterium]|nr:ATP-binding cassette domain-containing protein [Candidatus Nanopelagicales bacterium]
MSTQTAPTTLRADGVSIRFGGVQALNKVSLQANPGEITALIGPNGAGKSTMLGCLSGTLDQNEGQIFLGDTNISKASAQKRASMAMARTFQSPQLVTELTVRQHVVLAARAGKQVRSGKFATSLRFVLDLIPFISRGISKAEIETADELINELGLRKERDKGPSDLTLGQRRLLEVALCLATNAKVMLLDEPSAGLDRAETVHLGEVIKQLASERNITIILVEHDLELVFSISSSVFVLDFGQLIDNGTPAEMRASKAVQAAYLGTVED